MTRTGCPSDGQWRVDNEEVVVGSPPRGRPASAHCGPQLRLARPPLARRSPGFCRLRRRPVLGLSLLVLPAASVLRIRAAPDGSRPAAAGVRRTAGDCRAGASRGLGSRAAALLVLLPALRRLLPERADLHRALGQGPLEDAMKSLLLAAPLAVLLGACATIPTRSEEHTSELQSLAYLVCRLLLEKKKKNKLVQVSSSSEVPDQ